MAPLPFMGLFPGRDMADNHSSCLEGWVYV
jgi:hypothetical protein